MKCCCDLATGSGVGVVTGQDNLLSVVSLVRQNRQLLRFPEASSALVS